MDFVANFGRHYVYDQIVLCLYVQSLNETDWQKDIQFAKQFQEQIFIQGHCVEL